MFSLASPRPVTPLGILSERLAVLAGRHGKSKRASDAQPARSLTLLTTLLDFSDTGILDVFVDEAFVRQRQRTLGGVDGKLSVADIGLANAHAYFNTDGLFTFSGDFSVGKEFDAVLWRAPSGSDLAVNLANAADTTDALARVFALATPADVAQVWLRGQPVART